jgi:hypothetical protein
LFTENISLGYSENAWYYSFDAKVLTGIAIAYDVSYYMQFITLYAWNTWKFSHLECVSTTDLKAAEITLPSNPQAAQFIDFGDSDEGEPPH